MGGPEAANAAEWAAFPGAITVHRRRFRAWCGMGDARGRKGAWGTRSRRVTTGLTIPIYLAQPLEKEKGVEEMSKDFVYGALTLLLAVGLIAALMFFQGEFSV